MASEYRWIVVYLCVWLASVDSIRSAAVDSVSSKSPEQTDADYIRLQELVRQELSGLIDRGVDRPEDAGLYATGSPVDTQVRHLRGPRGSRWRDLLFGYNDGTQNGGGGLLSRLRRPPQQPPPPPQNQNYHLDGMYDYFVDSANQEYEPAQSMYPSYNYQPSRTGQMMYDTYDGYSRRPNMWSGAGAPSSSYVYSDQPPIRGPGRRMGMRPPPPDSFSMTGGNGGPMQTIESFGRPGTYLVQVPARGRKNNAVIPSSQMFDSDSDGYTVIPIDTSTSDRLLNGAGLPIRVDGNGNNQNAMSRLPIPGSQSINSGNTGVPDSEVLSTNTEVPRVSGTQPSSQSIAVPVRTSGSGVSRVQLPSNRNDLRIESGGLSGNDGIDTNMIDLIPGSERLSNSATTPIRMDGRKNNQNQISRVSIPEVQTITPENMDIVDSTGVSNTLKLIPGNRGQSSTQTFTIPTSGSGGNRMQLPAVSMNDFSVNDGGYLDDIDFQVGGNGVSTVPGSRVGSGNTDIGTNEFRVGPEGLGLKGGSGGFLSNSELPSSRGGVRIGNNPITIPSSELLNSGSGGSISTTSLPMDLSRTPGSFRVTSGRTGQTSPSSSGGSIQGLPGLVSMSDVDAQHSYDMDIRNLEESSDSPSSIEIPSLGIEQMTPAVTQTVMNQPSEMVVDMMSSDVESPINLANQGISSVTTEPTSILRDVGPSKMLAAAENGGKALTKGAPKNFGGLFRWGKSTSKPSVVQTDMTNEIPTGNAVDAQSSLDEQTYARPAEPEMLEEGRNSKIQVEPMKSSMNFVQNAPESFTMNGGGGGNAMGAGHKRKGANQSSPGSYYIIQHPEDFSDIFADDNVGAYEQQLKPQMNKFVTRNQMQQPTMGDVGNAAVSAATQGLEFGQMQNSMKSGMRRMMSSGAGGDGSGAFGAGKSSGRPRQYKVLVVDGDHEILRGLKLPGMKPDSGVSSEV